MVSDTKQARKVSSAYELFQCFDKVFRTTENNHFWSVQKYKECDIFDHKLRHGDWRVHFDGNKEREKRLNTSKMYQFASNFLWKPYFKRP